MKQYFVSLVAALSTVGILRFAKVTKEEEPGFSWGPRPLQILEEDELRRKQRRQPPVVEILYPNDNDLVPKSHRRDYESRVSSQKKPTTSIIPGNDGSYAVKKHAPESFPAPKNRVTDKTKTSKIDIKVVKDPLRVEQYLRKHDKRKVYDCIQPNVHALESRGFVKE